MANGFTPEQEAFIEKVANELLDKVLPRALEHHIATCPIGVTIKRWKALVLGIAIGVVLASGGTAYAVVQMVLASVKGV